MIYDVEFDLHFSSDEEKLDLGFQSDKVEIENKFGQIETVVVHDEVYDGVYEIDPAVDAQVLETGNKYVERNITVNGVPIHRYLDANGEMIVVIGDE